jgi:hypothetical protein
MKEIIPPNDCEYEYERVEVGSPQEKSISYSLESA